MCLCCAGFKKKKELQKCFGIFGVIRLTCQELITITQHEPDSTQQYSNNALLKKKYSCLHVLKRKNTHACMYSREKILMPACTQEKKKNTCGCIYSRNITQNRRILNTLLPTVHILVSYLTLSTHVYSVQPIILKLKGLSS